MTRYLLLLSLLANGLALAADGPPEPSPAKTVSLNLNLLRLSKDAAVENHLPIAAQDSKGVQKIVSREEYQALLERISANGRLEVVPLSRLATGDKKEASLQLLKTFSYPSEYRVDPDSKVHVPTKIETTEIGVSVAVTPAVQSGDAALLKVQTGLLELAGYRASSNEAVKATPSEKTALWIDRLTRWRTPAGAESEPIIGGSIATIEALLDRRQILLVHGFAVEGKVTYFSIGLEIVQ